MKVIDVFRDSKSAFFSFEILPPLKGRDIQSLFAGIEPLLEFKPPFINVTYHRLEYVHKKRDGGVLEEVSIRKRPGTVGICAAIMNTYKVEAVPHLIAGGFSKEEIEDILIDLNYLGMHNVLALRGDPLKTEPMFVSTPVGHKYALGLIEQIMNMNRGVYLDGELHDAIPTDFCIGVAGYPEKHFESMSLKLDIKHLKEKLHAGGSYVVTQMFFDNQKYFDFVGKCREAGIEVPIAPGVKLITTMRQIAVLPKTFHIDFPDELADELEKCKTDADVETVGVEWAIHQSKGLMEFGVPCIHYYTMGKSEAVKRIASEVF